MLRSAKTLHDYTVLAKDGDIGKVYDFFFHDDTWIIRYMVVETGHWLSGRRVLLTPGALGTPDWSGLTFPVALTRGQVEKSPDVETDKPVSRQHELDLHGYYGWPGYWSDPGMGFWPPMMPLAPILAVKASAKATEEKADPYLRSAREVAGYHLHASDGGMGHVEDFIIEDPSWVIRYLVVQVSNWFPAKKVLISPQWLGGIRYLERKVDVNLTKDRILHCPEFHPAEVVNREYEMGLYDYYGQPGYWEKTVNPAKMNK
jgi:hypothetical protein